MALVAERIMDIQGKTALITGGASGLGAAADRMLAAAGARVFIADLNEPSGQALAQELGATFIKTDVTNEQQVQQAVEQAGKLHILVTTAGIGVAEKLIGKNGVHDLQKFVRVIQVNLIGTFDAARRAANLMTANEPDSDGHRGVIIMTASVAAFEGQVGQPAYSASKGGVVSMTLPLARELARHGIRVMTIAPGLFHTPLLAGLPEPARLSLGQSVPFPPRLGRPAEYAQLARQIIENPMLNGSVIRLDGAMRMAAK